MADQKSAGSKATNTGGFNPNPNQITTIEYQLIIKEKEELTQKQLDAGCEFMWQHYNRLLLVIDKTLARGTRANLASERRARKEQAEAKREAALPKKTA